MEIEKLIDLYHKKIYKLCLYYLGNKEEAEDLLQDIFIKVIKNHASFKGQSSEYTWVYRIAINTVLNYLKRKKILQFLSLDLLFDAGRVQFPITMDSPEIIMEQAQIKALETKKLEQALLSLSAREKTAFYLYHYDNLKQKNIAEIMDTSVPAVESLIHKAMKKVKKHMAHQPNTKKSK